MTLKNYNLYVGSCTGMLKGVTIGKNGNDIKAIPNNLVKNKDDISNKNEIKCLNWGSESNSEILIGMKNKVCVFDTVNEEFSERISLPSEESCGIFREKTSLFVGLTSGIITSVQFPSDEIKWTEILNVNKPIDRMKRSIVKPNVIATGGKSNDLKLWDLNTCETTFIAKNIKPDELQLQIPLWVSDMTFHRFSEKIATCSRHGYVRLYDPLISQRRPVFNAYKMDQVFTTISDTTNENQFLVGSGSGDLFLVDVRGKNSFVGKYKGFCGAVKNVACPPDQNYVFSVSLDRHFRIHNFTSRKLIFKEYMQSRLTSILYKEPFILQEIKKESSELNAEEEEDESGLESKTTMPGDFVKDAKVLDSLFSKMETIEDGSLGNKIFIKTKKVTRKMSINENEAADDIIRPKKIKWKKPS